MADMNEPKKETVRITPPPQPTNRPTVPAEKEAVPINLPNRPPPPRVVRPPSVPPPLPKAPTPPAPMPPIAKTPSSLPPPSAGLKPPIAPPSVTPPKSTIPAAPLQLVPPKPAPLVSSLGTTAGSRPAQGGPRKETTRIADSPMKATVRLSPIQPPSSPAVAPQTPAGMAESIPASLCWGLFAVSGLLLLTQLWSYFS